MSKNFNKINNSSHQKELIFSRSLKIDKIKETIRELLEISSIQGLPIIIKTKRLGFKLMWILLLIASSVACFYFGIKCLNDYLEFEYFTSIRYIHEKEPFFPMISICNYFDTDFEMHNLYLSFKSQKITDWKEHFEVYFDQVYGKCFRFNSGKNYFNQTIPIKTSLGGCNYGLWFEFSINNDRDYNSLVIAILNQTKNSLFNKEYYLSSGSYNYFKIDRILEKNLAYPYNDCYEDVNLFPFNKTLINYILNKSLTYTQEYCFDLCRTMFYIDTNNTCSDCVLSNYEKIVDYCVGECVSEVIRNFYGIGQYQICSNYCPLECNSFNFDIQQCSEYIQSTGVINNTFEHPQFVTYDNASRAYFGLFFYYNDLKYTFISQQPKIQLFDLISMIGGIFGLFLGMGLLSFVEIIHLLFEIFLIIFT